PCSDNVSEESLLARQEQSTNSRFQKERKDTLDRQWLADHSACDARKLRPVGAELKFHRNASDHADQKIDGEDSGPEPGGLVIALILMADRNRLQHDHQQRQPHGELRE